MGANGELWSDITDFRGLLLLLLPQANTLLLFFVKHSNCN
jgi:hypothetical protein